MDIITISTNETLPLSKQRVLYKEESYPFVANLIIIVAMAQTIQAMATLPQAPDTDIRTMAIQVMAILVKITLNRYRIFTVQGK